MLEAAIICPDNRLCETLQETLRSTGRVRISRVFPAYPDGHELSRVLSSASAPDAIFLSGESLTWALAVADAAMTQSPETQVIAVVRNPNPSDLLQMMRAGVRECLSLPFDPADVDAVLNRAAAHSENRKRADTGGIYTFLPSKPGVGTSTVALNTSLAIAALKHKTLLADLDLSGGIVRFLLKLNNTNSIQQAAEMAAEMDEGLWQRVITSIDKLDVLHSGPFNPDFQPTPTQIRHLASFWCRKYEAVIVDLGGELNEHSMELMQESRQIFLVCTAETASLHQAKAKRDYLAAQGCGHRVKLIVNRDARHVAITPKQIEQLLEAPVQMVLSNDYEGVQDAVHFGRGVDRSSALGKQFTALARSITGETAAVPESSAKSLLGWFSSRRVRQVLEVA